MKKKLLLSVIALGVIAVMFFVASQPTNAKTGVISKDGFVKTHPVLTNAIQEKKKDNVQKAAVDEKKVVEEANTTPTEQNVQVDNSQQPAPQQENVQQTQVVQPVVNTNYDCNGSGNCGGVNCQSSNCPYKNHNNQNVNHTNSNNNGQHHGGENKKHGEH